MSAIIVVSSNCVETVTMNGTFLKASMKISRSVMARMGFPPQMKNASMGKVR
jgi:hypothetical protein